MHPKQKCPGQTVIRIALSSTCMASGSSPRSARVSLPDGLGGGDIHEFLRRLGLSGTRTPSSDHWDVILDHREEDMVRCLQIAGPDIKRDRFDVLNPSTELDSTLTLSSKRIRQAIGQLDPAAQAGELPAILRTIQVQLMSAQSTELVALAQEALTQLRSMSQETEEFIFPHSGLRSVEISNRFYQIAKFAQLMLRLRQDPELHHSLSQGPLNPGNTLPEGQFQAADQHVQELTLRDTFLDPLLASIPTGIWAFSTNRLRNPYVFTLGKVVQDRHETNLRMSDVLAGDPAGRHTVKPLDQTTNPKAWGQAVDWWCLKTNAIFTRVGDITQFTDNNDDNVYLPELHLMWLMDTVETFKRVAEVANSWHSAFGTTLTTYTALDLIAETWHGTSDMAKLVEPDMVSAALSRVRAAIPVPLHPILLPAAEAAGRAPDLIFDGFFQSKQRESDIVEIVLPPSKGGSQTRREPWSKKTAIRQLVRARRNATHGFVGKPHSDPNIHILTQHNGKLPSEFAMLPYLYLLDILCRPDEILNNAIPRSISKFLPRKQN